MHKAYLLSKVRRIWSSLKIKGSLMVVELVRDKKYEVVVLTRDTNNKRAQDLLSMGNVELLEGTFTDVNLVSKAMEGCDGAV